MPHRAIQRPFSRRSVRSPREARHMKDFAGRFAVVTGGGSGMGRELVRQLVAEGCNVATCDVFAEAMAETKRLCEADRPPQGLRYLLRSGSDRASLLG